MNQLERFFQLNKEYNEKSVLKRKAIIFSTEILALTTKLDKQFKIYPLTNQLIRSATSVGANASEADRAISPADFIHKLSISQKEASEAKYWISLLFTASYMDEANFQKFWNAADELYRIITSSILTTRKNLTSRTNTKRTPNH